ncbi:MAG: SDR family oxidoreductase [Anaerolineales bacterium]|nr:SDR family oxidoreductase [Anaerolineales bacterium]
MVNSLFDLSGRVALVSGAASGFGRAIALGLAEFGADLMLADLNAEGVQQTAAEIEQMGRRAVPEACDVTDFDQIRTLYERLDQAYGRIDILANVAGPAVAGSPEEIAIEDVQKTIQWLVVSRFYCCQQGGRRMLAAGKGSIINIGSLASITALGRGHIAYSMAMGAVAQMTRELSTEWSSRGVRVNAILPGQVPTPNNRLYERMAADPNLRNFFLRGIPIGRLGVSDDIKGLAVLLASDASSWITGALIPLDGGNLAKNAGGSHPGMPV